MQVSVSGDSAEIAVALVGLTTVAYAVSSRVPALRRMFGESTAAVASEETANASFCERKGTISSYEQSSITKQEIDKLVASPKYQAWLRSNEARLGEIEASRQRADLWKSLTVFSLVLLGVLGLPFCSFALDAEGTATLNDILRTVQPLPLRFAGCVGLMALVCSFFAPVDRSINQMSAILGLIVLLATTGAFAAGAGYIALLVAVTLRLFWLA